jgi:hypothetical protein
MLNWTKLIISGLRTCTLIALLLATCSDTTATVLYVRVTPQEIVIGADSKRTAETGVTVCVCKITRIDDTFIASAGLAEFGAFDPREIALQAIKDSRTLVEARVKFEQQIEQPLVDVLTKLRARNRERYEAFKKGAAVNMIFARFNDEPELVGSALTPKDEKDGSISLVKNQITLMDVQKSKRIFVGVSKRTEMILDRPSLWSKGTVAGVQRVLEMSIEDNKEAGGPIDIVQITKGGVRWFPREPECDSRSRRVNDQPSTCNSARH